MKALARARRTGAMLERARSLAASSDEDSSREAAEVVRLLKEYVGVRVGECERLRETAPSAALEGLVALSRELSPSEEAGELRDLAREWSEDPAFKRRVEAERLYARLETLASSLERKLGEAGASSKNAPLYAGQLSLVYRIARKLNSEHRGTDYAAKAASICRRLDLPAP
jgi:hypothetical protein